MAGIADLATCFMWNAFLSLRSWRGKLVHHSSTKQEVSVLGGFMPRIEKRSTVRTRIKKNTVWFCSYILGIFRKISLKMFLKLFLKLKYCIDYQQMKSMYKHNILINQCIPCQHVVSAAKKEIWTQMGEQRIYSKV